MSNPISRVNHFGVVLLRRKKSEFLVSGLTASSYNHTAYADLLCACTGGKAGLINRSGTRAALWFWKLSLQPWMCHISIHGVL